MDEQLMERLEEVWEVLQTLTEDAIALEAFCLSEERCAADYSSGSCAAYLRRIDDYIKGHLNDLQQVLEFLIERSTRRLKA